MTDRDLIHDYLKSLSKYLARLARPDADEVIREIESHIFDAVEAEGDDADVSAILERFGAPRELAEQYVGHILEGTPPPAGFRAIQKVKTGATKGLYLATLIFGYGWSLLFLALGLIKLIFPDEIVIWEADQGNSFIIGGPAQMPAGSIEIVGLWLIPIALGMGAGLLYLTRRLTAILKDRL